MRKRRRRSAGVQSVRSTRSAIGGDCQTPLAAHATVAGARLTLHALVAEIDGSALLTDRIAGAVQDAAVLGERLARALLARGAAAIIARARTHTTPGPM